MHAADISVADSAVGGDMIGTAVIAHHVVEDRRKRVSVELE